MAHIRSAGLRGLRAVVAELGGDAEQYARAAGMQIEALDSDDVMVPDATLVDVLEIAALGLDCADLGLRVAARQDLTMLGSLAVAIQHSPTLGDALACTSRYLSVQGRSLSLNQIPDPQGRPGVIGLRYAAATSSGPVQGTDLGIGFTHRSITYLHGGPYDLRSLELPYRPPAPPSRYEEFFGAPVTFGARTNAAVLRVPERLMEHRLEGVNDNLRRLALAFLSEQVVDEPGDDALAPRVRAAVRELLGTSPVEVAAVARLLAVHQRTLQRRLEQEDTTFYAIVDDVRREAALQLLTHTDLPIGQVSGSVGFAEQSALSRAARRWWGSSPREIRQGSNPTPQTSKARTSYSP